MIKFSDYLETEAVPPMGVGEAPENPDTHNDSRVLNKELGISDQDAAEADRTKTFLCHAPITFPNDGVKVLGPTEVRIEQINDNMYKLTVYATNPRKIQDLNGNDYKGGNIEFSKEVNKETVEALKGQGWNSGGPNIGGGIPPNPMMMAHTEYPTFQSWVSLKETGTSTADVACFSQPMFSKPIRRIKKKASL